MWILQTDGSYLNSNDSSYRVKQKDGKWILYKNNIVVNLFDTLEQAVGAGPS